MVGERVETVPKILIVGDTRERFESQSRCLEAQGYWVETAEGCRAALHMVEEQAYDLLLVDQCALQGDGVKLIERLQRSHPDLPQVVVADAEKRKLALEALRAGAHSIVWTSAEDLTELEFAVARGLEWKRLTRESARYHSLTFNFPGIIFWSDLAFAVERIYGRVEEITGYRPEAFTPGGLRWDQIVQPEESAETFLQAQQCLIQGETADMEYRLRRADGTLRWVECMLMPIAGQDDERQSVFGVVFDLDITGRKQIEMELSQRLQEQELLFAIGQLVSSSLQINEVMERVAEYMTYLANAASCAISDWDPEARTLTVRAEYVRSDQADLDDPINDVGQVYHVSEYPGTATALRDREPFVVYADDPEADPHERRLLQLYQWHGVAGIPLVVQDRVIGLAEVYLAESDQRFDFHDLRLLQALSNQVAVAIDNARLFDTVQTSEAAMRDLSLRLIHVQEQESRRLALELHDQLGQILTATKINIDLARRKLAEPAASSDADRIALLLSRLDEASALTDQTLTNVRAMTVELRPTLLDDLGIVPTLRWFLGRFAERTGVQVQLDAFELPVRLQPEIETTIYRVTQEALTNVARHAQASQVRVQMTYTDDTVTVVVEDDGLGFDLVAWSERRGEQQSLGLVGIEERAMLLDGQARITSQPGRGTRVEMMLPARFTVERKG